MTPQQKVYDAERAKNVLENDVFQQVFADIEQELIEQWKSSNSAVDREKTHQYIQLLSLFKTRLMTTFETGKLAQVQLTHERSRRERLSEKLENLLQFN